MSQQKMRLRVLGGGRARAADMEELPACKQDLVDKSGPAAAGVAPFRVALVSMPFGTDAADPSIQLGLLRAIAEEAGFPTDTYHLYLDLAAPGQRAGRAGLVRDAGDRRLASYPRPGGPQSAG